jgi:hypothetical protein
MSRYGTVSEILMESRTRSILANLATVTEDLIALSDDIWLDIDHNDSDAVRRGADFKVAYNAAMSQFAGAAGEVSRLIQGFTMVSSLPSLAAPSDPDERSRRERLIRDLDSRAAHSLAEDFRYKRPCGFALGGEKVGGTTAWQTVYEAVWRLLATGNPPRAATVPDDAAFTSNRGNKIFSREQRDLRDGREFARGIYAEVNLSANQIRDNIKRLLRHFGVPESAFTIYLREDRDADPIETNEH